MITGSCEIADTELVAAVRAGDDAAFEELFRRYEERIKGFVRGMLGDPARAEDVTQEAFLSALRRLRETESEISFKPWIYEIARNAAIDSYRRASRATEISMDADGGLRPSDRLRLEGPPAPESALLVKERLEHLRGAFDELSDVHMRVLVLRELEGCSYREIGERLELTRPAVESALFRARRRLESEYAELSEGRRCRKMRGVIVRLAEGLGDRIDQQRLDRHARRCTACRRRAREFGVELHVPSRLREKIGALLPLPSHWLPFGSQAAGGFGERAAALVAAAALAGAGGFAVGESGVLDGASGPDGPAVKAPESDVAPAAAPTRTPARDDGRRARPDGNRGAGAGRQQPRADRPGATRGRAREDGAVSGSDTSTTTAPTQSKAGAAPQLPDVSGALPEAPTGGQVLVPETQEPLPTLSPEASPQLTVPEVTVPDLGDPAGTIDDTVDDVNTVVGGALP